MTTCQTCGLAYNEAVLTHTPLNDCVTVLLAKTAALQEAKQQTTVNLDQAQPSGPRRGGVTIVS